ncbi:hypothetical protein [Desulfosediminicola flagellatus]|uniref:hypothetical protein n=1 Tax=Desulfosediminicola flagellatus TaxID=2569541 RepID=UPI001294795B|nr:hypothetical protein [Desulfosediminicola flagellatus]
MNENLDLNGPVQKEAPKKPEPAWYDFIVKIVQDLLNFNMHTYTKEKAPRL